ncbi:hypothetical protein L6R50_11180 [Myxococcota bacterium]|nr:hypothetical protein [Myxococcota bacterium]
MTATNRPVDCAGTKAIALLRPADVGVAQRAAAEEHLRGCELCRREVEREGEILDLVTALPRPRSALTSAEVLAMDPSARAPGDAAPPGPRAIPPPAPARRRPARVLARWWAPVSGLALAAAATALALLLPRPPADPDASSPPPPAAEDGGAAPVPAGEGPTPGAASAPLAAGRAPRAAVAPRRAGPAGEAAHRWKGDAPRLAARADLVASVERRTLGLTELLPAADGVRLHDDDALAFRFRIEGQGWLLLVEVGPDGAVRPVHPADGVSLPVATGAFSMADASGGPLVWRADGGAGAYRYVALVGDRPFRVAELPADRIGAAGDGTEVAPGIAATDALATVREEGGGGRSD